MPGLAKLKGVHRHDIERVEMSITISTVIILVGGSISMIFGLALFYHSHVDFPMDCSGISITHIKNSCNQIVNQINNVIIGSELFGLILIMLVVANLINRFLNPKSTMYSERYN